MKIKSHLIKTLSVALFSISSLSHAASTTPASKEWVLKQIALAISQIQITAQDWANLCNTGSPTNSSGCYGNVSSASFTTIDNNLGGFTTYANINPANGATNSVFVKAFLAGTNTPVSSTTITVAVHPGAARCALFTQAGGGIGPRGISSDNPVNGSTTTSDPPPHTPSVIAINNASTSSTVFYNNTFVAPQSPANVPHPIYLLCVGYNPNDGSSAASILNNVTAT